MNGSGKIPKKLTEGGEIFFPACFHLTLFRLRISSSNLDLPSPLKVGLVSKRPKILDKLLKGTLTELSSCSFFGVKIWSGLVWSGHHPSLHALHGKHSCYDENECGACWGLLHNHCIVLYTIVLYCIGDFSIIRPHSPAQSHYHIRSPVPSTTSTKAKHATAVCTVSSCLSLC